jgi:hypothetical protein
MAVGRGHTLWIETKGVLTAVDAEQLHVLDRFAELCPTNRCWLIRPTDDLQEIANWIWWPETSPVRFGWDETTLARAVKNRARKTTKR